MPSISPQQAAEAVAGRVERADAVELREIQAELFPEETESVPTTRSDIVSHIRAGLAAEELVDLWNVVFPADRNVRYDEVTETIRYNEELVEQAG